MDPTAPHHPDGPPTRSSTTGLPPVPADPDPDLPVAPDLFADYRLLRSLGRGGMGEVFLARNVRLDRHEAIKVIHPGYVAHPGAAERFQREVRNAAQYQDQHIVTVYGYLQAGETIGFAMEYVPGPSLSELVKERGPLSVALACHYARQVALGLQRAHEKGMVHRDIKPGNLVVRRDGNKHLVKILDFGLSKVLADGPADVELTGAGRAMGTPAYAAPEQARDAAAADIRSDIYSLGGTLFYLLTGRSPFAGSSAIDLWRAHAETPAPSVTDIRPDVPAELAAVVAKMLAKDPAGRFPTPAEVAAALVPFIKPGGKGSSGPMPVPVELPPAEDRPAETLAATATWPAAEAVVVSDRPAGRRRGLVLAGAAGGVVLLTLVGLWAAGAFRGKADDRPRAGDGGAAGTTTAVPRPEPGAEELSEGFRPLFNGADKAGWVQLMYAGKGGWAPLSGRPDAWRVEGRTLFGTADKGTGGTVLATARDTYEDCEVELRAVRADFAPAALYVRFKGTPAGSRGYRVTLGGWEANPKTKRGVSPGSVRREDEGKKEGVGKYDAPAPKVVLRRNEPFTLRVRVEGRRVTTWLNGHETTFEDDQAPLPAGQIALSLSRDTAIQVKGIGVKELK